MPAVLHFLNRWLPCIVLLTTAACAGCEARTWVRTLNDAFSMQDHRPGPREEEKHRREWRATKSRDSLYWLLENCVTSGMSYDDVCRVLGEEGAHEPRDNWVKTKSEFYQLGDDVYCFGPDNKGRSLYLVFREGALINFEPDDFRKTAGKPAREKAD